MPISIPKNNRTHGMTKVICYEPVVVTGRITKYKQELPDATTASRYGINW